MSAMYYQDRPCSQKTCHCHLDVTLARVVITRSDCTVRRASFSTPGQARCFCSGCFYTCLAEVVPTCCESRLPACLATHIPPRSTHQCLPEAGRQLWSCVLTTRSDRITACYTPDTFQGCNLESSHPCKIQAAAASLAGFLSKF